MFQCTSPTVFSTSERISTFNFSKRAGDALEKESLQCLALLAHTQTVALNDDSFSELQRMNGFLDCLAEIMGTHDVSRFVEMVLEKYAVHAASAPTQLLAAVQTLPLTNAMVGRRRVLVQ